jgi:uncharacterized protein
MSVRVIRESDLVRVPWKNGGGTTAEVAAFPEGSTFETFGWRISMADVEGDGPFSLFPGIDRTLILVEGSGIELEVEGVPYRLDPQVPKLSFAGDDRTVGRLLAEPIRDLNVMTRRNRFSHSARIIEAGVALLSEDAATAFIVPIDSNLDVTVKNELHTLRRLDCLVLDGSQDLIQLVGSGRAILVEIAPGFSAPDDDGQR